MDMKVKKGEKCFECDRYYDRHIVVDALILKDKKVLMILRNKPQHKGYWALIGGYINWDETVEQAVEREVKEEIGVKVRIKDVHGVYSNPDRDPDGVQNVDISFLCEIDDENFIIDPVEVADVRWFSLDNLPEKIAFDHRKIIVDYIDKIRKYEI